jgi:hypothetical protein
MCLIKAWFDLATQNFVNIACTPALRPQFLVQFVQTSSPADFLRPEISAVDVGLTGLGGLGGF